MRSRFNIVLFAIIFIAPLLALTVYELRYATDRYNSDASIVITEGQSSSPTLDLSAIGLSPSGSGKDALVLLQFILSEDMLKYLDDQMKLREHYSDPQVDWWSRLPASASLEDFHDYISNYIVADYAQDSQIIHIHVESFNREYSQRLVELILSRSQEFVDKLNAKVTTEQTAFFERQLQASEQRLREVKSELLKFQTENRLLSTDAEATLITSNIGELEKALLAKEGELATSARDLNDSSPQIQVLKSEIGSLEDQLAKEKDRLSGGDNKALSELDAKFREIQFNLEFTGNIYKSNLTQLEAIRLQAAQRLKYLVIVTQPSIADSSLYPNRPYIIGTAAMILIMIFFIVSLLVAIIREHA
jgi:capsular polysaccharide transport system permease protein